eukprot:TRINITY_DN1793_c0_g1_i1.p1 TRINITY_DN1793_c0_g1~~TRINITY_DN1793_c0_g1_i1.p1  ORF type:complete len:546 (+),score=150.79 TRINITY_DN1793_c0_g1_i1:57-1640(+)
MAEQHIAPIGSAAPPRLWTTPPHQLDKVHRRKRHAHKKAAATAAGVAKDPLNLDELLEAVPVQADDEMSELSHLPLSSVVKIEVVSTAPNYSTPWQMQAQEESSGSGFVLPGKRIITNAHVVEHHSIVRVRTHNSAELYLAKVLCIGFECDLALLTVEDPVFWDIGIPTLKLAGLPRLYEDIMVIGYPIGGDNVSVTRGIVSRIDMLPYVTRPVDNSAELLVVQIDAAINPGNSGGPACNVRGEVVGVAFAGLLKAQSIGYIIPLPVIRNFLHQFDHSGGFRGVCELGIDTQMMMNKAIRKKYKLQPKQSGVLVSDVEPLASVASALKVDDVLLAVDGVTVANDGTILYKEARAALRLNLNVLTSLKYFGDTVKFKVLRDGAELDLQVTLAPVPKLVPAFHTLDAFPSYFIVGGFVFCVLSIPLINSMFESEDVEISTALSTIQKAVHSPKKSADEEFIVLLKVLIAEVNFGYDSESMVQLHKFNGETVINLRDFITKVKNCKSEFYEFLIGDSEKIVLDAEDCRVR